VDGNEILLLGLGIQSPWKLLDQRLDIDKQPHELHLTVGSDRGTQYACPVCGGSCAAHDFQEKTWRHLNFFQHVRHDVVHSFITDDLVFCHQYPTTPCVGGNAEV
jgi:transposase